MLHRAIVILLILMICGAAAAGSAPFHLDQPSIESYANDFWTIYGISEGETWRNASEPAIGSAPYALEWMALKGVWTDHPIRAALRDVLIGVHVNGTNSSGRMPRGYVWASTDNEKWAGLHYHYDQISRFICSAAEYYAWTRDRKFLQEMQPSLEMAMDYMLRNMRGRQGLVICPGENNGLSELGKPSTCMDCAREGYKVAWINEGFYSALLSMIRIESDLNHRTELAIYKPIANSFPAKFDKTFWLPSANRYAGWIDVRGGVHDYGYTYVNLEALARGLGNADRAYHIFHWLDNGRGQPTQRGCAIGSTDIYQLVVGPRTNTRRIADKDWDPFSHRARPILGSFYKYGYGGLAKDGGTMLWFNYYDVMARLQWLDADCAWLRFYNMLYHCASDPKFLTFGTPGKEGFRCYDIHGEHFLEIGSGCGCPESGIAVMSLLHGFMGVRPTGAGLRIQPNLPSSVLSLGCNGISYSGEKYDICIKHGEIDTCINSHNAADNIDPIGTSQVFISGSPFTRIGVYLGNYSVSGSRVRITLQKKSGEKWMGVCSSIVPVSMDNSWLYMAVPRSKGQGEYRLMLRNVGRSKIAWYRDAKVTMGGWSAARGGKRVAGLYTMRLIRDNLEPIRTVRTERPKRGICEFHCIKSFSWFDVKLQLLNSRITAVSLNLERKMGNHWQEVADRRYDVISNSPVLPVALADQPAGDYRIVVNSGSKAVSGVRLAAITIFGQIYDIQAGPKEFLSKVAAGNSVLVRAQK